MKRLILFVLLVATLFLASCSKTGTKNNDEIISDIESSALYSCLNVETVDFEIIKRMTDSNTRTDAVYVKISGQNEVCSVIRHYLVEYKLYNDGWILERISPYVHADYQDVTLARRAPTEAEIEGFIEKYNLVQYARFPKYILDTNEKSVMVDGAKWTEGTHHLTYKFENYYRYQLYTEYIQYSVIFDFMETIDGEWKWCPYLNIEDNQCVAKINTEIEGEWEAIYNNVLGTISISYIDEEKCYCKINWFNNAYAEGYAKIVAVKQDDGSAVCGLRWIEENQSFPLEIELSSDDYLRRGWFGFERIK